MSREAKLTLGLSIGATLFVAVAALITRNPGLIILAGLSAASAAGIWARYRRPRA